MFVFEKSLGAQSAPAVELLPTTAGEVYAEGEALKLSGGGLTKAGPTDKPEYIAARAYTAPASGGAPLPAYPVLEQYLFETTFGVDGTAVKEGDKVTLHTDGAQITAATTGGAASVVRKLGGGAMGSKALVRFL